MVIGIDVGSKGCLTTITDSGKWILEVLPYNLKKYTDWFLTKQFTKECYLIIEDVSSMYGNSAQSNFTFGTRLGEVLTLCEIAIKNGLQPHHIYFVRPREWQKALGVKSKGRDNVKKEVADIVEKHFGKLSLKEWNCYGKKTKKLNVDITDSIGIALSFFYWMEE